MTLDSTTLFVVTGLVSIVCGVVFLLQILLRANDAVGRLWSGFFVGVLFTVFAYLVGVLDIGAWWAIAVGNGTFVAALGFLWSGFRAADHRRHLLMVPLVVGALVVLAGLLPGPDGGYWAGSFEMFLGVAATAAASAAASARGRLGRSPSSRVFAVTLAGFAAYYLARAVAFVALGPDSPGFGFYFGTSASLLVETALIVVGTTTLLSIQAARTVGGSSVERELTDRPRIDGVLAPAAFREVAESWLARGLRARAPLALLLVEVADLRVINAAFGRTAGDSALRAVGRAAVAHAPTAALVGRVSARRFGVLMAASAAESIEAVAASIRDGALHAQVDERDRFRVTTFHGIGTTSAVGSRFEDLVRAAQQAIEVESALALDGIDDLLAGT